MAARSTAVLTTAILMLMLLVPTAAQEPAAPPPTGAFGADKLLPPPEFCPPSSLPCHSLAIPFVEPNRDNAFTLHDPDAPRGFWYAGVGAMGLVRAKPGHRLVAVRDPNNIDTGIFPPPSANTAVSFGDVTPHYSWGVRAHVGCGCGPHAIELAGFYLGDQTATFTHDDRGRLDLPFANFPPPFGFTGNNFLWLQADRVELSIGYEIGNAELNYRYTACWGTEFFLGVRYFDLRERFAIRTDDEVLSGPPDPLRVATYSTRTHSEILGAQIGFETSVPLVPIFALGTFAKGMVGYNWYDVSQDLVRGDGFQGPSGSRSDDRVSYLIELGVFFDLCLSDRFKFRAGYQGLCVGNLPAAHNQVNFNPNVGGGRTHDNDVIFFHGPIIEFQFLF